MVSTLLLLVQALKREKVAPGMAQSLCGTNGYVLSILGSAIKELCKGEEKRCLVPADMV